MNFRIFKNKYQNVPVEHYPSNTPEQPLVSVCVQTYQHANFIEDCLEGILMQEVDFPIEILLGEDASTDGTREICIDYAKIYPERIRLFLHDRENNIKINGQPTGRFNFLYNLFHTRGKYIAICEGDDYWSNPLKLKKQVQILEQEEDYSLVVGGFKSLNTDTGEEEIVIKEMDSYKKEEGYKFSEVSLSKGWITKTLTALFKKKAINDLDYTKFEWFRDVHLFHHILQKGEGYYICDILGVYRIHKDGVYSLKSNKYKVICDYHIYKEIYTEYKDEFARKKFLRSIKLIFRFSFNPPENKLSYFVLLKQSIRLVRSGREFLSLIKALIPKKVKNLLSKN